MDDSIEIGLSGLHKKFKFIWFAVLTGMLAIITISYILYDFQIIELDPVVNPQDADKIALVTIVIIILIMFFLKRSYLVVGKIKEKAERYKNKINSRDFSFLTLENDNHALFAAAVVYINKVYLTIWFLADLVVLIAFMNFILAPLLDTFLIYAFVGIYSLIANYPSIRTYKKLYNYIVP